jgi:hypothetical protein
MRRRRRVVLPLAGLISRLRALIIAGLVSRIDVVRRPSPAFQIAVFNPLAVEELTNKRKTVR